MNNKSSRLESSAVQGYLSMLQGIINRMAGNSSSCKTWTATLVAAQLALLVGKPIQLHVLWVCLIPVLPVLALCFLDCYYLGLERITIDIQRDFLKSLSMDSEVYINKLYDVSSLGDKKRQRKEAKKAIRSYSIWPFYLLIYSSAAIIGLITQL